MQSTSSEILLCLNSLGFTKSKISKLINIFGDLKNILTDLDAKRELVVNVLSEGVFNNLKLCLTEDRIRDVQIELEKYDVKAVTIYDENFPKKLRNIPDAPFVIYYKGDINLTESEHILGVVGTRKPSSYGRDIAEKFVFEVAREGVITVSGLAYGIDSVVANETLKAKGKTIAVLGGGLAKIYPSTNQNLADEIVKTGGLIISEYKPTDNPTQYTFPERNRLISGISDGVLIIEAGEKSGSLITAEHALNQGKDLFVVPGNLTSFQSKGSNRLIYEIPHCMVIEPKNILDSLGVSPKLDNADSENIAVQLTMAQKLVYDLLKVEDMHFDDLAQKLKMSPRDLNVLLTDMEMVGIIKSQSGNYYGV